MISLPFSRVADDTTRRRLAILEVGVTSMQSLPMRTTGH